MTQSKLRLNTDIRKKISGIILSHFENEKRIELENYITAKEDITTAYNTYTSDKAINWRHLKRRCTRGN